MSVAIFVTNESEASCLIPWGIRFARAGIHDLIIVCPRKSKGKVGFEPLGEPDEESAVLHKTVFEQLAKFQCDDVSLKHNITAGEASSDHDRIIISVFEMVSPDPASEFVNQFRELDVELLVLPIFKPTRGTSENSEWEEKLFYSAPCGVVSVTGQVSAEDSPLNLLFASELEEDNDDIFALEQTARLGRSSKGKVTLLYVRPSDDPVARDVAQRHLDRLEKSIRNRQLEIEKVIELADTFSEGLNQLDLREYDLVVVGTRSSKVIRSITADIKAKQENQNVTLGVMRQAVPFSDRMWTRARQLIRNHIPQVTREHRVDLVDRLSNSSSFNFDFMALISLSTLIAGLGLVQNSVAVVIGAMLVAPLMTPLVSIGLALVQANERLLKSAALAVVFGFSNALLIGALIGLAVLFAMPGYTVGTELTSRAYPNLLDVVVALASGVAAAYAMSRPNLLSALPGVAIAAALVPPIATSGVTFALGHWLLAWGALLLFLVNILAIILGTAVTFWAVGISTYVAGAESGRTHRSWPRYWFLAFFFLTFFLAAELWINPLRKTPPIEMNGTNEVRKTLDRADKAEKESTSRSSKD